MFTTKSVVALLLLVCMAMAFHSTNTKLFAYPVIRSSHGFKGPLTANATAEVHESLFRKILTVVIPDIVLLVRNLTIPGNSSENFSYDTIKLSSFNIQNVSITFAAPDVVFVNIQGLSLAIPPTGFSIADTILGLKANCTGKFWVTLQPTNMILEMHMTTNSDGKLTFSHGNTTVQFGDLSINHSFDQVLCQVAQDIIEVFTGSIGAIIRRLIEQDLPKSIAPLIEKTLNDAFDKLPLVAVGNPIVTSDSITITIDLLGAPQSRSPQMKKHRFLKQWKKARDLARDIILTISQQSITNILIFEEQKQHLQGNISLPVTFLNTSSLTLLIPQLATICSGCPITLDIQSTQAPSIQINNDAITASVTMLNVALSAISATNKTIPLFDININASLGIIDLSVKGDQNNIIWFQLQLNSFAFAVGKSEIGPLDINSLSTIVEILLKSVLIPDFNNKFKGIPLPNEINDVVLTAIPPNLLLAIDVDLS